MNRSFFAYPAIAASALALTGLPVAAIAQDGATSAPSTVAAQGEFAKFAPRPDGKELKLDYEFLDDALSYMVMSMGVSTRHGAGRPAPGMGTRQVYGHDSRYRMEGNRVVFSFLEDEAIAPLTEYRQDLERLGTELDIAKLPRNEQLAYWINLHNVAVIEQIGLNYPVKSPDKVLIGADRTPLDSAKFITVGGVTMSPRDIRTRIVYPNWSDPKVMYGFFRGDIGGPSIQRRAYKGDEIGLALKLNATEFVNSLRGVENWGKTLLVSLIYEEAAPFYFRDLEPDLRAHLAKHAEEDVAAILAKTDRMKYNDYAIDIADLAAGDREPTYNTIENAMTGQVQSSRVPFSIARLLQERQQKYEILREEGRLGRVIVLPMPGTEAAEEATGEVE